MTYPYKFIIRIAGLPVFEIDCFKRINNKHSHHICYRVPQHFVQVLGDQVLVDAQRRTAVGSLATGAVTYSLCAAISDPACPGMDGRSGVLYLGNNLTRYS